MNDFTIFLLETGLIFPVSSTSFKTSLQDFTDLWTAILSEEKKEYNLLYIDHLNQNFDNPILRKKLISLSEKEKGRSGKEPRKEEEEGQSGEDFPRFFDKSY